MISWSSGSCDCSVSSDSPQLVKWRTWGCDCRPLSASPASPMMGPTHKVLSKKMAEGPVSDP